MKKILLAISSLFIALMVFPQANAKISGEGNGTCVKLMWLTEKWEDGMQGVVVKRRTISNNGKKGEWEQLSENVIEPGLWRDKPTANLTNNQTLAYQLEQIKQLMIIGQYPNARNVVERTSESIIKEFLKYPEESKIALIFMLNMDYNITMLMGMGYADYSLPKNKSLEYGIFKVKNGSVDNTPLSTYIWELGTKPDLSMDVKKQKLKRKGELVELRWTLNTELIRENKAVKGCNIYRISGSDTMKLNQSKVFFNSKNDRFTFYYEDKIPNKNYPYTYVLKGETAFGTEGEGYALGYKPNEHPDKIPEPVMTTDAIRRNDFINKGLTVNWTFPEIYEPAISGFRLARRYDMSGDFQFITDTLPISARTYFENSMERGHKFYEYRVHVMHEIGAPTWSNAVQLEYFPRPEAPAAVNLKGEGYFNNGISYVRLNWTKEGNATFKGFVVYTNYGSIAMGKMNEIEPTQNTSVEFKAFGTQGMKHKFYVASLDSEGKIRNESNTVEVIIPNNRISLQFETNVLGGNSIQCKWKVTNLHFEDVEGFRIFIDDRLAENGTILDNSATEFIIQNVESGKHKITIEAFTIYDNSRKIDKTVTIQ